MIRTVFARFIFSIWCIWALCVFVSFGIASFNLVSDLRSAKETQQRCEVYGIISQQSSAMIIGSVRKAVVSGMSEDDVWRCLKQTTEYKKAVASGYSQLEILKQLNLPDRLEYAYDYTKIDPVDHFYGMLGAIVGTGLGFAGIFIFVSFVFLGVADPRKVRAIFFAEAG